MEIIEEIIAERLGGKQFGKNTELYKFALIKEAKAKAKILNPGLRLIDFGVGEPDLPADRLIVETLYNEAGREENRFYSDNGTEEFSEAAIKYLHNIYGINCPGTGNILHGIGSKPVLAMLPVCFINPGDVALATVPGYPVISTWTRYLGGQVFNLPLYEENSFYPELESIPKPVLKRARILYINYPNNPTGQVATREFYKQVVEFAYKNNIAVISDAAYGALTYDGQKPLSFLSVDGAMEVGVEVHSLSKAFNMTGWRIAFLAGNSKIIKAYGTVKDNTDSGQFRAIQKAGIYALNHPELTDGYTKKYSRRFDMLVEALNGAGFAAEKPKGTFYCYVKAPAGAGDVRFHTAAAASEYLMEKALISTVPWDEAGAYLRFSVTFEARTEQEEQEIINELAKRLKSLKLRF